MLGGECQKMGGMTEMTPEVGGVTDRDGQRGERMGA